MVGDEFGSDSAGISLPHIEIDMEIQELWARYERIQGELERLLLLVFEREYWRPWGFANFGDYCEHRFGRKPSWGYHLKHTASLMLEAPALREARDSGLIKPSIARDAAALLRRGVFENEDAALRAAQTMTSQQLSELGASASGGPVTLRISGIPRDLWLEYYEPLVLHLQRCNLARKSPSPCDVFTILLAEYITNHHEVFAGDVAAPDDVDRRLVLFVAARDSWMCQRPGCGEYGITIHHIVPRSEAPELIEDTDNMIALCMACHRSVKPGTKGRLLPGQFRLYRVESALVWEFHNRAPVMRQWPKPQEPGDCDEAKVCDSGM